MGLGFRFQLPGNISCRICWGFPLMRNHYETNSKCGRFHFELSLTPDFDALVAMRKPKGVEQVKQDDPTKIAGINNKKIKNDSQPKVSVAKSTNPSEVTAERAPRSYKKFKDTTVFTELWTGVYGENVGNIMPVAYYRTVFPEIWDGVNGASLSNIQPVTCSKTVRIAKSKLKKVKV